MNTTITSPSTPVLQTRDQRILGILQTLLYNDKNLEKRFTNLKKERSLNQLQALVRRSGLLQTTLFLVRKHNEEVRKKIKDYKAIAALELVSMVLQGLWDETLSKTETEKLFKPVPGQNPTGAAKTDKPVYLDPQALGALDLITYQRFQLDALHVAELASELVEARAELEGDEQ